MSAPGRTAGPLPIHRVPDGRGSGFSRQGEQDRAQYFLWASEFLGYGYGVWQTGRRAHREEGTQVREQRGVGRRNRDRPAGEGAQRWRSGGQ